ncbi:MAG: thiamine pyrophosphate-binding protein [Burkholderiales bacterium]|nr:thiamine pyrophosphate-binding protein [Burkholderiales bacterium]
MPSAALSARPRLAGHALVEALVVQGVDTVFGVPGESFLAALDGFHQHAGRIRFVACRHEGGAAFMAEAHGKLTGRPGVCFVTRGPGATNASIGVHVAFQDSTPMLLLVGQVAAEQRDREAFQEIDYRQMFGPGTLGLAKWVAEVHAADRLPEYLARAFRTAMQGRPGPVVLALPEDMLSTLTAAPVLARVEPARAWPDPHVLAQFRQLLIRSERPFAIVGGSGWTAGSAADFERFVEDWEIPVGCAFRYQDVFDNRHRLYAGDVGIGVNPKLAQRIRESDLLLAIGVRMGEMTTSGYTLPEAPVPRQPLVHIHAGAEELGRVYQPTIALQCSTSAIGDALEDVDPPTPRSPVHGVQAHAEYLANLEAAPVEPMDLAVVVKTIEAMAPAGTVYTNGAGNYAGWLHRFHRYTSLQREGRTQLAPTAGAMGYGVPAAIAANLLFPDRTAVAIAGDGDFLMTGQELATATAHAAGRGAGKLVVVVVDNGSYGTIRMHQEREYPARVSGTTLTNPDFVQLARAYGWHAERVETTAAFEPAFGRAMQAQGPTLLHLLLPEDVSTSRTTLTALRAAALKKQGA